MKNRAFRLLLPLPAILLTLVFLMGSGSLPVSKSSGTSQPLRAADTTLLFTLQRGACFGTCPIYLMKVYQSGRVWYKGERFVNLVGVYEKKLNSATLKKLRKLFKDYKFSEFQPEYDDRNITDLPMTILTLYQKGKPPRSVKARHNVPSAFYELVKKIEDTVGESGYTLISTSGQ